MNRIKTLREELKMTQQELANKLDGAKSTIAMYENETRKPSLEVLVSLSEIFNCSIDYILCKSDIRNPESNTSQTPVIRKIERGARKLNDRDQERAFNMLKLAFEEAFDESSDDD